ncbi:MAG: UDP-N-acetylglucosamine 1-carboxyvinyltransferase [Clostridiales bacterium]|nr:UDP-N-acetylglucosamine 1-carboxyvinyltransferase [Clostridiales bacterium]
MNYLKVAGGTPLCGEITVQGSKNAALPILAACLLGNGPCVIENCPRIQDVEDTLTILRTLGCEAVREGTTVSVNASSLDKDTICGVEAARIRSSVLFLGALLGKIGKAVLPYPGGCAIGTRPIDIHLEALEHFGVCFVGRNKKEGGEHRIIAQAEHLHGAGIELAMPSVGATENAVLAAVLADGNTRIRRAAREPEVDELCRFLNLRGADIVREPDGDIWIHGKKTLSPVRYRLNADRIVAGSYLLAILTCKGSARIRNFPCQELGSLLQIVKQMGADVQADGLVSMQSQPRAVDYVETAPYPGFPTDLQSPLMAVLCTAKGRSRIRETVFENRFRTAVQLGKMGARIETEGDCARIEGIAYLKGADVYAPDLRGGAALTVAAAGAHGITRIRGYEYISRGHEDICRDLKSLGADIRRMRV